MTTIINGFELLRAIGQHAETFPSLKAEVGKIAPTLLKKHLKASSLSIDNLRATKSAIGAQTFLLIIDQLSDKELRSLLKNVDKHYAELDVATEQSLRDHLRALANAEAEPAAKSRTKTDKAKSSGAKAKATPSPKPKKGAKWPESMEAAPSRRRG